ncbi:MAG: Fe-S cluster assembly protein SufD [Nevskiales bacterium]|nr:Fe-S cluster assembly protein SufD [Nevskiales bacterium]
MSPSYTAAFETVLRESPAVARESRTENLNAFLKAGFPNKRQEDWRYTDLSPLAEQNFALAAPGEIPDLSSRFLPGTDRLVFVNGRFDATASDYPPGAIARRAEFATPVDVFEKDSISHLNAALALDGLALRLAPQTRLDRPLHVLSVTSPGAAPAMSHLTHSINLEPGAEATVIFEDLTHGDGTHLLTQRVWLRAMDHARLNVIRLQEHGSGVQALTRWDASVERNATLDWINLDLGGHLVRNDLVMTLAAPEARVNLSGVYAPGGTTHVDNHTRIEHFWPGGVSRETYRGIVKDRARAVFNGRIVVHPQAFKTDSAQHVANLLLSPEAEVNAKPELQIDNDDVRCTHGATCGQLDEYAIYYLRSRGIPLDTARRALLYSFAREVLANIAFEPARQRMEQALLARLPGTPEVLP